MNGQLPERLQEAIAEDLKPVKPLRSPWMRASAVPLLALALTTAAIAVLGLRNDGLGPLMLWFPMAIEVFGGFVLVALALRESIPGWATPSKVVAGALLAGVGLHVAVTFGVTLIIGKSLPGSAAGGMACMATESCFAFPAFVLTAVLVLKAMAVRPVVAGLLGGAGAGLTAAGIEHLLCPMVDLAHQLAGHTSGIIVLAALGALGGWIAGRLR